MAARHATGHARIGRGIEDTLTRSPEDEPDELRLARGIERPSDGTRAFPSGVEYLLDPTHADEARVPDRSLGRSDVHRAIQPHRERGCVAVVAAGQGRQDQRRPGPWTCAPAPQGRAGHGDAGLRGGAGIDAGPVAFGLRASGGSLVKGSAVLPVVQARP